MGVFKSSKKPNSPVNSTMSSNSTASVKEAADHPLAGLNIEVRGYAMAAVILEEWLQELAAIAQEQSVMMKEIAFQLGMAIDGGDTTTTTTTKNTNINNANVMSKTGAILENHP